MTSAATAKPSKLSWCTQLSMCCRSAAAGERRSRRGRSGSCGGAGSHESKIKTRSCTVNAVIQHHYSPHYICISAAYVRFTHVMTLDCWHTQIGVYDPHMTCVINLNFLFGWAPSATLLNTIFQCHEFTHVRPINLFWKDKYNYWTVTFYNSTVYLSTYACNVQHDSKTTLAGFASECF